ncbi:PKD domain-containing protein [Natrinema salinisoli]|uniref:PKD domain-containing protein n=1 Tax=Natrinema salinisoli TaxID=2878535 RepID=UPI001CF0AA0D|nr:PKD domain-containing protein [Natrinema salinisoli]
MPSQQSTPNRRSVLQSLGALGALGVTGIGTAAGVRAQFEPLGSVDISGGVAEAVASDDGETAYVAIDAGFVSVDISDPAAPSVIAERTDTGLSGVMDVKEDGDRVIVVGPGNSTGSVNGMGLYDVSDPSNPTSLAFHDTDFAIHNAYLTEDVAYLIDNGSAEVVMIDVSGDDPSEINRWGLSGASTLHDLWIQDGIAYLCYWDDGTVMLDVSDPNNPSQIGTVRDGSSRSGNNDHYVTLDADASICAIGKEQIGSRSHLGVELWDVSDKTDTQFLAEIDPPSQPSGGERTSHNLDIVGDYVYTSWYEGGIRVHDISDPSEPEEIASWRGDGASFWTAEVAVEGETVIASDESIASGNGGLYTFPDPRADSDQPPTARIDAPNAVTVGESATFDGADSADPDGTIAGYEWDFGDGATASGETVSHAYDETGQYTVRLEVTDDDGNSDTATATVSVEEESDEAPIARLEVIPASPSVGEQVTFDGSGSSDPDGTITGYEWVVDGEEVGTGDTAEYTFDATGTYDVELTVTDDDGNSDTASERITVEDDGGGECGDETESTTENGRLSWWDDGDVYTYETSTTSPCNIEIVLDGPTYFADFDLYVTYDGREPTPGDYDDRATSSDADESIESALDGQTDVGILVDRYSGRGEYTVTITENGR